MHFGSFRYQPGQLGSADLVPIFFVIVSLYPHGKTVLLKSQFLLPQSGTFFRPEGKMATLSCCNWQPPAISHGFTLSYLKVLLIELVAFTATLNYTSWPSATTDMQDWTLRGTPLVFCFAFRTKRAENHVIRWQAASRYGPTRPVFRAYMNNFSFISHILVSFQVVADYITDIILYQLQTEVTCR